MATTVQQLVSALIDKIYPVGVIIGFTQDIDPNEQIGGGWKQIKDCFLYASGSKALGTTGGEETHVLTVAEMPSHSHKFNRWIAYQEATAGYWDNIKIPGTSDTTYVHTGPVDTSPSGGSAAHNNMPPYKVVNFWERIS